MSGAIYSPVSYYDAALILYNGVEKASGRLITRRDSNIARKEWAYFLTEARKKVMAAVQKRNDRWLSRDQETVAFPDREFVIVDPPESGLLKHVPYSITLVEWQSGGRWVPLDHVEDWERYSYDVAGAGFPPCWNLDGPRLRLLPQGARTLRITYVAVPGRIAVTDLPAEDGTGGDDKHDYTVPVAVQHAVPVWAAIMASVRDGSASQRTDLSALWNEALDDIATASQRRQSASPEYAVFTRDGVS